MFKGIADFFEFAKYKTDFRTELLAGVSTFLSLSYIFVVNPAILSAAGIPVSAAFFATVVGSVIATLAMGLWARLPFAVAPGLEMNAYVAYVVVASLGFTWQGALGAVFWSGVLTVLLSLTPLRVKIIDAIPTSLKSGLAAAVGVFLLLIALNVSGILSYEGVKLQGLGDVTSSQAVVFAAGLIFVLLLRALKFRGSILLSIVGAAIVAHLLGIGQVAEPIRLSGDLFAATFALDWSVILNPKIWSVILILFILDFYGSIAKFIGLTRNTSIVDAKGNVPRLKEGLIVDGGGTVLGAVTGTSNLIAYVESAVGIGEGGRTGFVAFVVAILMSFFLFLVPLINLIPVVATTGALFFVGCSLLPKAHEFAKYQWIDVVAVLAMILTTLATFGLDKAMFAGFAAYVILALLAGRVRAANWYLVGSAVLLFISLLLA